MIKKQIVDKIKEGKIIVIVRGVADKDLVPLCQALYDGGIRLVELTFDMQGKIPTEQTAMNIRTLCNAFDGKMLIGAGTVVTVEQARHAVAAGAKYLISPNTDEKVISFACANNVVSIPGAMTPTEVVNAFNYGADFVKLFPSDTLGIPYIKAIKAPLSAIPMLAVGGVTEKNVADFLSTGVAGVGVGSSIVRKDLIERGEFSKITEIAKIYCDAIATAK